MADGSAAPLLLPGYSHFATAAAFSLDGTRIVTASDDGTARIWRADGSAAPLLLKDDSRFVSVAAFRRDDLPLLAGLFARGSGSPSPGLSASTLASLCAYRWPGNVREPRNTVERLLVLGPGTLPGSPSADKPPDFHHAREEALKAFERAYLEALSCGHVTAA